MGENSSTECPAVSIHMRVPLCGAVTCVCECTCHISVSDNDFGNFPNKGSKQRSPSHEFP